MLPLVAGSVNSHGYLFWLPVFAYAKTLSNRCHRSHPLSWMLHYARFGEKSPGAVSSFVGSFHLWIGEECSEGEFKKVMAKLARLPSEAVISAFKGVVDFYLWKGMPCARKWPTWPKRLAYPEERANQEDFAYINRLFSQLPNYLQQQYRDMAADTPFTGKDLFVRAYMKGIDY